MSLERDGLHGVHREERVFTLPRRAVEAVLANLLSETLGPEPPARTEVHEVLGETCRFVVETRSLLGRIRLSATTKTREAGELGVEVTAETLDSPLVLLAALAFAVATAGAGLLVLAVFTVPLAKKRARQRGALVHAVFAALEALEHEPLGSYRKSAYAVRTRPRPRGSPDASVLAALVEPRDLRNERKR